MRTGASSIVTFAKVFMKDEEEIEEPNMSEDTN